ncbi:acyl-[acyl-carrier-protein] thioesterase [Pseudodesulfovibrio sp.]|uniref:acyl-[acyl-carrier-protein] thioesterase n=1 Tax=unclassified Pseudodesulfovibrio TaxID=2661612 RepID=UPI003AFF72DA
MHETSPLIYEHAYDIRSYEPRTDGLVPITTICDQLQDVASRHADSLGFGFKDLRTTGHFWMLVRLYLLMDRLPAFGETCRVQTWPSGNERLVAGRDFLVHDEKGCIGRATSHWVAVDLETHKACPPGEVLDNRYIPDAERALLMPSGAVPRLREGTDETIITARRSDQDINNHVNNVRYGEFCFEAVPEHWLEHHRCMGLEIQFKNEAHAGDSFVSSCAASGEEEGGQIMQHALRRQDDNREIVRMRSLWQDIRHP